jgi:hypothetical protein
MVTGDLKRDPKHAVICTDQASGAVVTWSHRSIQMPPETVYLYSPYTESIAPARWQRHEI